MRSLDCGEHTWWLGAQYGGNGHNPGGSWGCVRGDQTLEGFDDERNRGGMDNAKVFSLSTCNAEAEGGADSRRKMESLGLNM